MLNHDDFTQIKRAILDSLSGPSTTMLAVQSLLGFLSEYDLQQMVEDETSPLSRFLIHAGLRATILERLEKDLFKCPCCGSAPTEWRYLEDVQSWRNVCAWDPASKEIRIESAYQLGDGYDSGYRNFFECHASVNGNTCLTTWPISGLVTLEFI